MAVWGVIALALTTGAMVDDLGSYGYPCLVWAILVASCPLSVAVHELGHAVAGVLVGRRIYLLSIGRGASLASWTFGDLQIVLARDLGCGFIQAYPERREPRWRTSLYLAGGILANLMAAAIAIEWLADLSPETGAATVKCLACSVVGFALSNLATAALAVIPRRMKWGDGRLASDGRRLVDLWRRTSAAPDYAPLHVAYRGDRLMRAGRWREAQEHYAAAIARAPDQPGFLGCLVHVIARDRGPAAAMACYAERRAAFDAAAREPSPQYGYAVGNVAWQALRTGDASWRGLAAELSAQAVSMDPGSAPLRATRGAALIAEGDRRAGTALLEAALREVENLVDKAEFCSFLARQARHHGESSTGEAFERLETHLLTKARAQAAR